eukprot:TRINITY_DN14957_c0_g1_i1.p1 TRINITY_DN14957_c0_g1~~TRINITY_DN14957_c0_g1_i1.p1  ORF type:complete len:314 (+),score=46.47 TRINITY_DN14957_c0_g1_i1:102-1043(+)
MLQQRFLHLLFYLHVILFKAFCQPPGRAEVFHANHSVRLHSSVKVRHLFAHRFRFPKPFEDTILCVPQKNGNRNFGSLLHVMYFGGPPKSIEELLQGMATYDYTQVLPNDKVWMLARNPYTRLLSLYLQKAANRCSSGNLGCGDQYAQAHLGYRGSETLSFEAFVDVVAQRSFESRGDPCLIEKHLCSQVSGCAFGVHQLLILKLERQKDWFVNFAANLGLDNSKLFGNDWLQISGKPCFYTPTGNCSDMFTTPLSGSKRSTVVDNVHGTGAEAQLLQHYNPRTAALVFELYKEDFAALGYEKWNGYEWPPLD